MHQKVQRKSDIYGKENNEEGERIKEKQVGICQHGLTVIQIGIPVRKKTLAAEVVNQARTRKGVIIDVAIKEHRGGESYLPKNGEQGSDDDRHRRDVKSKVGGPRFQCRSV